MSFIYDMIDTWNAGATTFTAIKMNVTDTASAAGSLLMDLQVGGVSKIKGTKAGSLIASNGDAVNPGFSFIDATSTGFYRRSPGQVVYSQATVDIAGYTGGGFSLRDSVSLGWSSDSDPVGLLDLILARDAPNTLAQRNGTAAQSFRLYNTFTDASNYERLETAWASNILSLRTAAAGTGVARALRLGAGGTDYWEVGATTGHFLGVTAAGGIGYGTGAGGTVTQATDKSTGVTLNTVTGEITMNAAALAANTTVSFTLTNSTIAATDLVLITHDSAGTAGAYTVTAQGGAGTANVAVRNVTAGSLSEAIVLKYAVFKAVNA